MAYAIHPVLVYPGVLLLVLYNILVILQVLVLSWCSGVVPLVLYTIPPVLVYPGVVVWWCGGVVPLVLYTIPPVLVYPGVVV